MTSNPGQSLERDAGLELRPPTKQRVVDKSNERLLEESSSSKHFFTRIPSRFLTTAAVLLTILSIILIILLIVLFIQYKNVDEEVRRLQRLNPFGKIEKENVMCQTIPTSECTNAEDKTRTCTSPECLRSAASLLQSMDIKSNPCDSFYDFVCGNWSKQHPKPYFSAENNWDNDRTYNFVLPKINEFLVRKNPESDSVAVKKARSMYKACINSEKSEEETKLEPLLKVLQKIGLPLSPPRSSSEYDESRKKLNISLSGILAKVKTTLGKDVILYTNVMPDPIDNTKNLIAIGAPNGISSLPRDIFANNKNFPIENTLIRLLKGNETEKETAKKFFNNFIEKFEEMSRETKRSKTSDIKKMAKNLYNIYTKIKMEGLALINSSKHAKIFHMNVKQLHDATTNSNTDKSSHDDVAQINWYEYLEVIFKESGGFKKDQAMTVYSLDYYKEISRILSEHAEYQIALYVWFEVVSPLIPFSSEEVRSMSHELLSGTGNPVPKIPPREIECTITVTQMMSNAIAFGYADLNNEFYEKRHESTKYVGDMLKNIEKAMTNFINKTDWLDSNSKTALLNKVKTIEKFIGYPDDWFIKYNNKNSDFNTFYNGLNVTEDEYLLSVINYAEERVKRMLKKLSARNDPRSTDFDPLAMKTEFLLEENSIAIPSGVLQFPFFNMGIDALNYGALGTMIGRELMQVLGTTGSPYDKLGYIWQFWTNETTKMFNDKKKCFANSYSGSYGITTVFDDKTNNYDIADITGIKDAFYGYQQLKNRTNYLEYKLPGLRNYTDDQLFYISFAYSLCESPEMEKSNLTGDLRRARSKLPDQMSPQNSLVSHVMSNSKDFVNTWNCRSNLRENSEIKCQLW